MENNMCSRLKDSGNFIFLALVLHGIGILIPWNMVINSGNFYINYKLNVGSNVTSEAHHMTWIRQNFYSIIGTSSQTPNLIVTALNIYFPAKGGYKGLTKRITVSMIVMIISLLLNITFALIDNKGWPLTWFFLQLSIFIVLYVANGVYQNCFYGIAGRLPMKYSNAVVIGSNVCGTLVSIMAIASHAISPNPLTEAVLYFSVATLIVIACFIVLFFHELSAFYCYYMERSEVAESALPKENEEIPYRQIFWKISVMCFNIFFVFWVTLFVFPTVTGNVVPKDGVFTKDDKWFGQIFNFLIFNVSAMIGNLVPEYLPWTNLPPNKVWIYVVARIIFIPFFFTCNYLPTQRTLPVVFGDIAFAIGIFFFGFTHGQGSSWAMMYAPGFVEPKHAGVAGMMAAFFLVMGLFAGVHTGFAAPLIVKTA